LVEDSPASLTALKRRLEALGLSAEFPVGFPRELLVEELSNLARRLREGPAAPLRIAFFGPTGAGKSKLFNTLAGGIVSPSSYRRPFTMRAVYLVHEGQDAAPGASGDVKRWREDAWRDAVLIDTPDFDSVERANRKEAERVFREVDALVFVTDIQKYADHSTWDYLEKVFAAAKPVVLVLNKASGDGPAADFFGRLEARFGSALAGAERIVLREDRLADDVLLPPSDPGIARLRAGLEQLVVPAKRRSLLVDRLRADLDGFFHSWDEAAAKLRARLAGLSDLKARIEERAGAAASRVEADQRFGVDPALKEEVYSRVIERLQKLDILRYPRKLLALPIEGLKTLVRRFFPEREARREAVEERGPWGSDVFQRLESSLLEFYEGVREEVEAEPRCVGAIDDAAFRTLRLSHEEVARLYGEREERFAAWLKQEAVATASTLTGENKAKFILSQLIYNSIIVGVQIHTAGAFTLAELATDSVLSPLVAKGVGMALSSSRVAEFENAARAEHGRLLMEVVAEGKRRLAARLDEAGAWGAEFTGLAADVEACRARRQEMVAEFLARDPHGSP
jgi:energy-coupling factor transporter ATP-binding protein EcfA2